MKKDSSIDKRVFFSLSLVVCLHVMTFTAFASGGGISNIGNTVAKLFSEVATPLGLVAVGYGVIRDYMQTRHIIKSLILMLVGSALVLVATNFDKLKSLAEQVLSSLQI